MAVLSRGRVVALVLVVLVAVAAVAVAVTSAGDPDGGPSSAKVPEGGSSFGDDAGGGRSLIDALKVLAGRSAESSGAGTVTASSGVPGPPAARSIPARRLTQLFMVGFRGKSADDPFVERLARRRWGVVVVDRSNFAGPEQLRGLTAALRGGVDGGPVPLIAAEQPGGRDSALRGLGPAGQPTVGSRAEAKDEARRAARRLRGLGVAMVLAPSADLGYAGGAWEDRAFSEDPVAVDRRVAGAIAGWQQARVAPAVGHFPGEGGASQDPVDGPATVGLGLEELRAADQRAFRTALGRAPALVLSNALYAAYDGVTPATLLPQVPALARKAGFDGTIVSGNLAATVLATGGSIATVAVQALKAGCDLLWIPGDAADQEAAYQAVVRAVRRGEIPQTRVRQALAHVAALKQRHAVRGAPARGGASGA